MKKEKIIKYLQLKKKSDGKEINWKEIIMYCYGNKKLILCLKEFLILLSFT